MRGKEKVSIAAFLDLCGLVYFAFLTAGFKSVLESGAFTFLREAGNPDIYLSCFEIVCPQVHFSLYCKSSNCTLTVTHY